MQVSRLNHTSTPSGVAYAETRGAITLPNWTEVGPNFLVLWERRRVLRDAASHHPKSWLAGKQFLNGLHGIEETIGLRGKRYEIVA